jgi:CspA family cold shock protein
MSNPFVQLADFNNVELSGKLKWFNEEKGFGFVLLDGKPDAFLHKKIVEKYEAVHGNLKLEDDMPIKVKVGKGKTENTLKVIEIIKE